MRCCFLTLSDERRVMMELSPDMKQKSYPLEQPGVSRAHAKAERHLQLANATIESIGRFGLSGTAIGKVTEIAGMSVVLANIHFESMDRLFEATLQHLADEQRAPWQTRDQGSDRNSHELLQAIATQVITEAGYPGINSVESARSIELLHDGLPLNVPPYPPEFRSEVCRQRGMTLITALFPQHFDATVTPH